MNGSSDIQKSISMWGKEQDKQNCSKITRTVILLKENHLGKCLASSDTEDDVTFIRLKMLGKEQAEQ